MSARDELLAAIWEWTECRDDETVHPCAVELLDAALAEAAAAEREACAVEIEGLHLRVVAIVIRERIAEKYDLAGAADLPSDGNAAQSQTSTHKTAAPRPAGHYRDPVGTVRTPAAGDDSEGGDV